METNSNSLNSLPNALPSNSVTATDSIAQTWNTNAGDWQEEVYQKIKTMKYMYYSDLSEMHQKICLKMQQHDSLLQHVNLEQLEKIRKFKTMFEKLMQILQISKNNILPTHREKLPSLEKQIVGLVNVDRHRQSAHIMQPGSLAPQTQSKPQVQQPHSQISEAESHEKKISYHLSMESNSNSLNSLPNALPSNSVTAADSTTQTRGTNAGDWQEEVYQKIKTMKDMYYADLSEMHQKICLKMQQHANLEQLEKLGKFRTMFEKLMQVLQISKNNILPTHREKLPSVEKQIVELLNVDRHRQSAHIMQPGSLPPEMQSMPQAQQPHSQISQAESHEVSVITNQFQH